MRTAKRLARALLAPFAGMVCPAGAFSAATYYLDGSAPARCVPGALLVRT
jgi:hypothetical protein